ncbi:phage tail sheath C-terminal domain-containing protein [Agathobaculum sp. NTUH-O15-33]|uniref:phage tail sheath subtilisin-like domain-containing protein n=1 Tax=Agathobaculum sp. NTUH-O15-33 TaxID=3079302 RepID=UPI002958611B|nr:phage tail sheath subtilisin-like domain-containing protein [Agathobaculum sp. NTUH-O15-33]WNX85787.1 phage tail sheath C-terminal domain-containing protein [Agathobaculum sp. NTUH-O15-33]
MGLPSIDITFKTAAYAAINMSDKGYLGLIVRDTKAAGKHRLTRAAQIPETLSADNKAYIQRAFTGYVNPPKAVYVFVTGADDTNLAEALAYFATQEVDYLCGPPDMTEAETTALLQWVKDRRSEHSHVKCVLPNNTANYDPAINFVATGMTDGEVTYTTAEYCSRIAGILAGTPWTMSATYAPLPELTDVDRMDTETADAAIDAGKLILIHDGRQVKIGRAVNSLTTVLPDHGETFKKIKILEVIDRVDADFRATIEDTFIGKYANSYDNRMLLITAGRVYLQQLEAAGILQQGASVLDIDVDAVRSYLDTHGTNTDDMDDDALRHADTGSNVFLTGTFKVLDAIEDVTIKITV